ncbi:hypothetical protein [Ramlibacter humi]|uniref:Uncharacterized protein n=1 Tax=Ramlibacter humi TaxID=2530451 RepID=A0A4Z0CB88_9BURK|nr:hypothetical protein [Ramlibacter humi]TFZ08162.1 hypothetical protein EZ216_03085 [Ramlibacter humi]
MRGPRQFTAAEWLRLLPVQQALKQARNDALLARYLRQRPDDLDKFIAGHTALQDKAVAIVIAFEQPWALDWQLRAARAMLADTTVLVLDNSRDEASRSRIQEVCRANGSPYLGLPPYRTRHVNRSHGMAMSWAYHNVVRPLRPSVFGFLDHDLVPIRPADPAERLGTQPVFGLLNAGNLDHWSLWAGYCFFRFDATQQLPLNFLYDFSRELDTGGRNWGPLYSRLDRQALRFAPRRFLPLRLPDGEEREVELVDGRWLHIGGISYNNNLEPKFAFFERLRRLLESGADPAALLVGE